MVVYNCHLCNFSTHLLSNYNRHLMTKKHQKNEQKMSKMSKMSTKKNNINTELNQKFQNLSDENQRFCVIFVEKTSKEFLI